MTSVMKGSQTPRFGHWPEYDTTKGDKVINLAKRFGFELEPWQKFVLRHSMGETDNPFKPGERRWAAFQVGLVVPRQNGKTFILYMRILAGLFLFDEKIVYTSQDMSSSEEAFGWIEELLRDKTNPLSAVLFKKVKKIWKRTGKWEIILHSGACFKIKNRAKKPGRGLAIDLLIIDEAYSYSEDNQAALEPVMTNRPNPQIWYVSTPPLDAVTGKPFTTVRQLGFERTERMAWFEWSVDASKPIDVKDRKLWYQANPSLGSMNFFEDILAIDVGKWPEERFKRERLAVWPLVEGNKLISVAAWEAVKDEQSTENGDIALAVDTCGWGDDEMTSITAYGIREDGLGHVEVIENRAGTDWVIKRLGELNEKYKPVAIGFDLKGPIGSLLIDLQKVGFKVPDNPEEPEYGDLAIPSSTEFSPACVQFVTAVKEQTFRHRGQAQLTSAVTGAKTRKVADSWAWDRYKSDTDISPLVAATLARWAYETRAHLVQSDYDISNSLYFG